MDSEEAQSAQQLAEGAEGEQNEEEYEQEQDEDVGDSQVEDDEDIFKNNHDLIGVEGILREQKAEINKIKVSRLTIWLV